MQVCIVVGENLGKKMFCNGEIRWIVMLFLAKRVFVKYKTLVVKMNDDLHAIEVTKNIFEFLCDVKVVMGLICIMPMLEAMHKLIKFAQCHDTFCVTLWE
jgi:hypothetical protein